MAIEFYDNDSVQLRTVKLNQLAQMIGETAAAGDEAQTTTYIAAMDVAPSDYVRFVINRCIKGLKDDGVYSQLDWLSFFNIHTAQAACLNVIDPTEEFTQVGAPTFQAYRGFTALSGANGYLDSGWNPTTDATNFLQDDACQGAWVSTNNKQFASCMGNANSRFDPWDANDRFTARANSGTGFNVTAIGGAAGLLIWNRSGAAAGKMFKNGVEVGSINTTSAALTNTDFFGLCDNNGGVPAPSTVRQYAVHLWGGNLSDAQNLALYNHVSELVSALGQL